MLDVVEEYNASESTSDIILETNNAHMEVHDLAKMVLVPICNSEKNIMSKDRELHPM